MIATLATLAAIVQVPFAVIAGIQPATFVVIISGYVFGSQIGFMVGAVAALVSILSGPRTLDPMANVLLGRVRVACRTPPARPNQFPLLLFARYRDFAAIFSDG